VEKPPLSTTPCDSHDRLFRSFVDIKISKAQGVTWNSRQMWHKRAPLVNEYFIAAESAVVSPRVHTASVLVVRSERCEKVGAAQYRMPRSLFLYGIPCSASNVPTLLFSSRHSRSYLERQQCDCKHSGPWMMLSLFLVLVQCKHGYLHGR